MKKAIVLGVHSFIDNNIKVGIQYIAEGLADIGWEVDYISIFSSLFDCYGKQRRRRFKRVWTKCQDTIGFKVKDGLTEYAFKAPFPAHKKSLRFESQLKYYRKIAPKWLKNKKYKLCIHDVTANIVYHPILNYEKAILRLNDLPDGFKYKLSPIIIEIIKKNITSNKYDDIWCAHEPLKNYVKNLNARSRVTTIPNGIDDMFISSVNKTNQSKKSAVLIGSLEKWVDLELLNKTAELLPDWGLDVIGPRNIKWKTHTSNLRWYPPVERKLVPKILSKYQVGLIPFKDVSDRLKYVERPLKFLEYLCCGLGVASTDVGSLRNGMGIYASYGNSPQSFAKAIILEAERGLSRSYDIIDGFYKKYAWSRITQLIKHRIDALYQLGSKA